MTSVYQHRTGGWYCQIILNGGRRVQLYLGKIPTTEAKKIGLWLQMLRDASARNCAPDAAAESWALGCDEKTKAKLEKWGLIKPSKSWQLSAWLDHYVEQTKMATSTYKGWQTTKTHLVRLFGDKLLKDITPGDCDRAKANMISAGYAASHWGKIMQRGKQVMQAAIRDRILQHNPFDGIKLSAKIDKSRQSYINAEVFDRIIENAPHQEARVLFALARYGGLRVPSEPLMLTWQDIDWEKQRIRIADETKTGERWLPIFAGQLFEQLRILHETTEEPHWVISRARQSAGTTWREWLQAAINASHATKWEKLWHNLRASCRTDLEAQGFAEHVCNAWLGHGTKVARDHYLRVTPDDWSRAAKVGTTVANLISKGAETQSR